MKIVKTKILAIKNIIIHKEFIVITPYTLNSSYCLDKNDNFIKKLVDAFDKSKQDKKEQ